MSARRRAARDPGLPERPGRDRLPARPSQVIVCRTCGYRYPVRDDIPVMLIDEAEKPASRPTVIDLDDVAALRARTPSRHARRDRGAASPLPRGVRRRRRAADAALGRRRDGRDVPAGWADRPSPATCSGRSSASGSACPSTSTGVPRCPPTRAAHARGRVVLLAATRPRRSRRSARRSRAGAGSLADHLGRHARRARQAPPGSPVVPVPGGFQPRAALGHLALRVARRARDGGPPPALAGDVDETVGELDRARRAARTGVAARRQPGEAARRRDRRPDPGDLGRRGHRCRRRDAVEDPDERERQGARVRGLDVASSTTTRSWGGPRRTASAARVDRAPPRRGAPGAGGAVPALLRHRARRGGRRSKRSAATGTLVRSRG